MDKTAVVEMVWKQRHRLYQKQVRRVARFQVHDPLNQCLSGDVVRIQEVRPISKTKRWRLLEILERHQVAEVRPIELESDAEAAVAADQTEPEEDDDQALPGEDDVDDEEAGDEAEEEE
jgi:small subunit ribosomal protein S17